MRVAIKKLVHGGQGLGRTDDGQVVFVWNALPGEVVEIDILKKKKTHIEGVAKEILTPAPERIEPEETHYLCSSPWGIMTWECENEWKKNISQETFHKIGNITDIECNIVAEKPLYGYRNKIEYSFYVDDPKDPDPEIYLAFFKRGGRGKIPITKSSLATPAITTTAEYILKWVQENKISIRSLKTLIVRSNQKGETIAALFLKDRLKFDSYPSLEHGMTGFQVYYSTHKSPASVPTELLYSDGDSHLIEEVYEKKLKYGLLSFFQVNIPLFEKTLKQIDVFIGKTQKLTDFYAGAGAIGVALAKEDRVVGLVESNKEAVEYANDAIHINGLEEQVTTVLNPAEEMLDMITPVGSLVVDPPRAGLHEKVVQRILSHGPQKVAYLSCNVSTQARDVGMLKHKYKIVDWTVYNYFPRTPHIESLVLLERSPQVDPSA